VLIDTGSADLWFPAKGAKGFDLSNGRGKES